MDVCLFVAAYVYTGIGACVRQAKLSEDGGEDKAEDGGEPAIQLRPKAHKKSVHEKKLKQEMEAMAGIVYRCATIRSLGSTADLAVADCHGLLAHSRLAAMIVDHWLSLTVGQHRAALHQLFLAVCLGVGDQFSAQHCRLLFLSG